MTQLSEAAILFLFLLQLQFLSGEPAPELTASARIRRVSVGPCSQQYSGYGALVYSAGGTWAWSTLDAACVVSVLANADDSARTRFSAETQR